MNKIESFKLKGIFQFFDHPGYKTEELKFWLDKYGSLFNLPGLEIDKTKNNTVMDSYKLKAANSVYPLTDHLMINNDTSTPSPTETTYSPSSVIYSTSPTEEYTRSGNINPFTVGWNITSETANGPWGSVLLVDASNQVICRALAGVTKTSGKGKLVFFTGKVL